MILLSPDNSASFGQTTDHWKDGMAVHLHLHMMLTAAMLAEHHQPIYLYSTLQEHMQICVISLYDEKLHTEMTKKIPYAQALHNGTSTNYKVNPLYRNDDYNRHGQL